MHTPAPWFVSGTTVYAVHGSPQRNRFTANVQAGRADDAPLIELASNARLIAAAPELLEALRGVVKTFPTDMDMHGAGWSVTDVDEACRAYDEARVAIEKATGRAA